MQSNKIIPRFSALEYGLILLCFSVCLTGALLLPMNQCPDEFMRSRLIVWMVEKGTLPTGDELETMALNPPPGLNYGFSFALRPYLSAMIGAAFVKAAMLFSDSDRVLLMAARLGSVLSVTGCCWFCLRLGHRLFDRRSSAILFAALVCFLPQVMFLGMYHNNDALSLFAVCMMLYYLVEGYDMGWPVKSCVGLALAFSVGLLSYYSIYGWILMCTVFCIVSVVTDREITDKGGLIVKRAGLIAGICLLLAGWFFIRSAILHDGDFLGVAYEEVSRSRVEKMGYILFPFRDFRAEGLSVTGFLRSNQFHWLRVTAGSFVGTFGNMTLFLPMFLYGIYFTIFAFGLLRFLTVLLRRRVGRRDGLLMLVMLVSGGINFALHFWSSYTCDYQPQGRYVITLILPLAYMLTYGVDKTTVAVQNPRPGKATELNPATVLTVLWLALFALAALGTMVKMLPQ